MNRTKSSDCSEAKTHVLRAKLEKKGSHFTTIYGMTEIKITQPPKNTSQRKMQLETKEKESLLRNKKKQNYGLKNKIENQLSVTKLNIQTFNDSIFTDSDP